MECQEDWVVEYSRWGGEFKNGIYKFHEREFQQVKAFLTGATQIIYFAEDHKELFSLIERDYRVHITNLDFHDDLFPYKRINKVACGSWASALVELKDCEVVMDWRQLHTKGIERLQKPYPENQRDMRIKWSHSLGFDGVVVIGDS